MDITVGLWITIAFITFIISVGLYGYKQISSKITPIKEDLEKINENYDEEFLMNSLLQKSWQNYERTFINRKTHSSANNFFNEYDIVLDRSNLANYTNILVGLGIIGTFAGLAFGLSDFNIDSVKEITSSIQGLLTGVDTAFWTSIAGMLCSLLYGWYFKRTMSYTNNLIGELCHFLDAKYKFTEEDKLRREFETYYKVQKTIVEEYYCSMDESGNIIYPKDRLKHIHEQLTHNTASIKSMSTDLNGVLENGLEVMVEGINNSLEEMLDRLMKMTSGQTDASLKEALESIKLLLANFNSSLAEPLNELAKKMDTVGSSVNELPSIVTQMKSSFDDIIIKFEHSISKLIGENEEVYKKTGETTDKIIGKTTQITEELTVSFEKLLEEIKGVIDSTKSTTKDMNDTAGKFNDSGKTILEATNGLTTTSKSFEKTSEHLESSTNDFTSKIEKISDKQSVVFSQLNSLTSEFSKVAESIDKLPMTIDLLKATVEDILSKFDAQTTKGRVEGAKINQETANQLREIGKLLGDTKGSYHSEINKVMGEFNKMLENTKNVAKEMGSSATKFNSSGEQFKSLTNDMLGSAGLLEESSSKLKDFGEIANQTIQKQADITEKITANVNSSITNMKNAGEKVQNNIQTSVDGMKNYTEGLSLAEQKMGEAFTVLHNNIENYNAATKDSLNDQLTNFTQQFTDATSILHDAVGNLTEILSEKGETISRKKIRQYNE
ncbi:methyl-accepting chemotaxis protein [Flammeovirga sp. EKP202]|uniref:methyl-accepting chemotaxis protein n=1 Tax=Flammeovirga sp. EKP202 TaxID=2770592 RepID=UPI00165F2562|nr:methyl-accepting chemotaxis protein [Flammeovirga sp. EKP202]MBD0404008.1 methyl-accepting chemotaxis protein [Flammeovirga sp. EKP202]